MNFKPITMQDLHVIWEANKSDELILDVRTPEEFEEGHVPKSRNISHDEVEEYFDELKKYKMIHVYCRSGGRAVFVTQLFEAQGITGVTCVAKGGIAQWIAAGYPVEGGGQ